MRKLAKRIRTLNTRCDLCYKFLLHPYNAHEIFAAAKLAKEIGVHDFHLRPVGWDNLEITKDKVKLDFSHLTDLINQQIGEAMKLNSSNFHVYGVRHKFNPDFTVKKNFSRCWAIPLLPTFGADGNVHTCFDMRGRKDLIMCRHQPDVTEIARFWNSQEHHELVESIKIEECPRCTFGAYNEIVEKVFIEDSMCRFFP
jgi:MoaA/NifB/PqqE/SkfB family radical SAM enzyme